MDTLKERIEKTKNWDKYHLSENICIMKNQFAIMEFLLELKGNQEERQRMFEGYKQYHFKDLGIIVLNWKYQGDSTWCFHGYVTPEELRNRIGEKQWAKFCQGKREFIIQRRIDGKNISKKPKK